jgi:hypothetical protein
MKHALDEMKEIPIYEAIAMARKKFGHRYPDPSAAPEIYHTWEVECARCKMPMRLTINFNFVSCFIDQKSINLSTWDVYQAEHRPMIMCGKFKAFL